MSGGCAVTGARVASEQDDATGRLLPARDAGALIYTVDLGRLDVRQRGHRERMAGARGE